MESSLTTFLSSQNIQYELHTHPPVFTCEEVAKLFPDNPGLQNKNLFLRDDKRQYYLLILPETKRLSTSRFREITGAKKVRFGSDEELYEILHLRPGGVTPLGLVYDTQRRVTLLIDEDIWNAPVLGFHPDTNTETLEFTQEMFRKIFVALAIEPRIVVF